MWNDVRTMDRITRLLLLVFVLALAYGGLLWIASHSIFDLRRVQVQGVSGKPLRYVDAVTVRSGVLPRIRGNFFSVDLNAARAAFETVPWVKHASVRRSWPNCLVVTVDEYVALGTWGGREGRLLSVDGVLFTANLAEAEEDGPLPLLGGPEDSEREVAQRFADLRTWLGPLQLKPRELTLSTRYAWSAKLESGLVLNIGRTHERDEMKARIDRLTSVYPRLASALQSQFDVIDLRYPNGLALRRRVQALPSPVEGNNAPGGMTRAERT